MTDYFSMSNEQLDRELKEANKWGGLGSYERSQIESEMRRRGKSDRERGYREVFGCGNAFHGRKYT